MAGAGRRVGAVSGLAGGTRRRGEGGRLVQGAGGRRVEVPGQQA